MLTPPSLPPYAICWGQNISPVLKVGTQIQLEYFLIQKYFMHHCFFKFADSISAEAVKI